MRALVFRYAVDLPPRLRRFSFRVTHDVFHVIIPERGNLLITLDPDDADHRLILSHIKDFAAYEKSDRSHSLAEINIPDEIIETAVMLLKADRELQLRRDQLASFLPQPPPAKFKAGDICQVVYRDPGAADKYMRANEVRVGTEVRVVRLDNGTRGDPWLPWQCMYEYRVRRLKNYAPTDPIGSFEEVFGEDELALLEAAK